MSCRSIGLLICMFTAVSLATLYRDPDSTTEWSVTESVREAGQGAGEELGALLDTRLASMLPHHSADMEGPVLRRLLAYLYTLPCWLSLTSGKPPLRTTLLRCWPQRAGPMQWRTSRESAPATTEAETSASIEVRTTTTTEAGTTEAGTTASSQPHSASQTPATAAPPLAACPTAPLDEATVSRLRSLSGEDRDSRLIQAADEGDVGELRALLAAGADVGARDEDGSTALHYAAWKGRVEATSCLLRAGAPVDARDSYWQYTALHGAAYWGHAAVARLLLAASADPNARGDDGRTPLHWAAMTGTAEVAAALLEGGADRGARNAAGRTPLDEARIREYEHLFEMLTQR